MVGFIERIKTARLRLTYSRQVHTFATTFDFPQFFGAVLGGMSDCCACSDTAVLITTTGLWSHLLLLPSQYRRLPES